MKKATPATIPRMNSCEDTWCERGWAATTPLVRARSPPHPLRCCVYAELHLHIDGVVPPTGCSDASGGPLVIGALGKLTEDDNSSKPFKVEYEGKSWWYTEDALTRQVAAAPSATAPPGRLRVGEMVTLHSNFGST